jgi:CRISPR-associated protein
MMRQKNPATPGRTALAPYNFVPLPNRVFEIANDKRFHVCTGGDQRPVWECHDRYIPELRNGSITIKLETVTPLFIRGPVTQHNGTWDSREARVRPEPAKRGEKPIIPGSSFRGMLRNLVEILSFAKVQPVTRRRPFFRSVGDHRMGIAYRERMIPNNEKPLGGFIRRIGDDWFIEPAEEVARIPLDLEVNGSTVKKLIGYFVGPKYRPKKHQHDKCWIQPQGSIVTDISFSDVSPGSDWKQGVLVLTGSVKSKQSEFVFIPPGIREQSNNWIPIPEDKWRRFHDDDQISPFQQETFPAAKGFLRDEDPVFYVSDSTPAEPKRLLFFGRAQLFRLPYDRGPYECIPSEVREAGLDLAEALFGTVTRGEGKERAIRGRIRVRDLIAEERADGHYYEEIIVPQILASPKPTCFPQYLVQDGTQPVAKLKTYFNEDAATIRGHKLYWQRWDQTGLGRVNDLNHSAIERALLNGEQNRYKQYTIIQPVRDGVTFSGRIDFENLTDIELGSILTALQLPGEGHPALGMAKPLGLGRVKVKECSLSLIDRKQRYESWSSSGALPVDATIFNNAFSSAITEHAEKSGELILEPKGDLWSIARLDALRVMLTSRPAVEDTRYLSLDEFRRKPVLPTPHFVAKLDEPWKNHTEVAGSTSTKEPLKTVTGVAPVTAGMKSEAPKEVTTGMIVDGILLSEKTNAKGSKFRIIQTGQIAILHPKSPQLPSDTAEGATLKFRVGTPGKPPQLFYLDPISP